MSGFSRRSLLKAAPAAVAAVPMTASALVRETSAVPFGAMGGLAPSAFTGTGVAPPEEYARMRLKELFKRRSKAKKEIEANRSYQRLAEAARLDSLRSISPTARMQLMANYDKALHLEQELGWIARELSEITEQHPALALIGEALS